MSDFGGMEDLLQDFLQEAGELLSDVDSKLVELEKRPDDKALLNDIFRGFHTIKGGAGFLNAEALVNLCHRTENLFDKLRNGELRLSPELMDVIMDATGTAQNMFGHLAQGVQPPTAASDLLANLDTALAGVPPTQAATIAVKASKPVVDDGTPAASQSSAIAADIDWQSLHSALTGIPETRQAAAVAESDEHGHTEPDHVGSSDHAAATPPKDSQPPRSSTGVPQQSLQKETTIRIDTTRLDQVLNLSGEIGLTKNRIGNLKTQIVHGNMAPETIKALDSAVNQLDLLVSDLQNAVMKTRMQPIGRLFQKYPRLARDLARQLGKDVEMVLSGEETELDKTMIEDLNDPLVHLVRNAVDHGIESPEERQAANKAGKSLVTLSASQVGDHIYIEITDDGRGMQPDVIRAKAVEKGLIDAEAANCLDDQQSLQLIFLPGFTTKDQISSVSGRGVGMDVVKTNIARLNGKIDIESIRGQGTTITISLPLTMAILPVLVVRLNNQSFAVPLSLVREIIPIRHSEVQRISGRATMVVREEVLPLRSLASLLDWEIKCAPAYGVLMHVGGHDFILAVDGFVGRDDVVIKPLSDIKPNGVSGATLSGDGSIVLVLDMEKLLAGSSKDTPYALFAEAA
ncbi:MAG: chemotaxis protein CheA [Hydrogenophilales bacterium CG03_land_8_20_14_0_80_62_28]|nr:chemotaxis protein CheA [Betaproteobacteria bacterium]OIO79310.1 MAG: chemotaxis protein CheA [Hydrogenophilaceae bacterium CG1_02_62_390]PIV24558.1 MAG: chemotaxis protein CheA [Hydrogenophilales bacterium CG03_land_8_20_14_0_80_62_28]PIW39030.1 MAG: chemotaxis protein CheA [Hydrogenophilales bacterium CG15_BIG_FIL_POST_REV_8_21_14_020_62_31]PIW70767.1 MAG: chemotaxis protein CheA [Hydrogenophilales bacterium CG12_big_fil_rev_8_21_14_0_65_61_21]PIY99544.1 MAG: chemotaxis protein CheA [Hydr